MTKFSDESDSESDRVRRKYLYRRMAMKGKVKIPARLAMKMVGPDCAFHLYSQHVPETDSDDESPKAKQKHKTKSKPRRK